MPRKKSRKTADENDEFSDNSQNPSQDSSQNPSQIYELDPPIRTSNENVYTREESQSMQDPLADTVSMFVTRHDDLKTYYLLEHKPRRGWWLPIKRIAYTEGVYQTAKKLEYEDGLACFEIKGIIASSYCRTSNQKASNVVLYASAKLTPGLGEGQRWVTLDEINTMERNEGNDENDTNHLMDQMPQQLASEYERNKCVLPCIPLSRYLDVFPSDGFLKSLDEVQTKLLHTGGYLHSGTFTTMHEFFFVTIHPATKMNYPIFKTLFDKDQVRYWNAFSCGEKRIHFKNFLLGFALSDPNCPLDDFFDVRTEFLFSFYNRNPKKNYLTGQEVRDFINDLFGFGDNEELINCKITEMGSQLGVNDLENRMSLVDFQKIVRIAGENSVNNVMRLQTPLASLLMPGTGGADAGMFSGNNIPKELKFSCGCLEQRNMRCPNGDNQSANNYGNPNSSADCNNNNNLPADYVQHRSSVMNEHVKMDPDVTYSVERNVKTHHVSYPIKNKLPFLPPGFNAPNSTSNNAATMDQKNEDTNTMNENTNNNNNADSGDEFENTTEHSTNSHASMDPQGYYSTWGQSRPFYSDDRPFESSHPPRQTVPYQARMVDVDRNTHNANAHNSSMSDYSTATPTISGGGAETNGNQSDSNANNCKNVCQAVADNLPYSTGIKPIYLPSAFSVPHQTLGTIITCGPNQDRFKDPPKPDVPLDVYSPSSKDIKQNARPGPINPAPGRVLRMPPPPTVSGTGDNSGEPTAYVCKDCQHVPYKLGYNVVDMRPSDEQTQLNVITIDQLNNEEPNPALKVDGSLSDFQLTSNSMRMLDILDRNFEGVIRLGQDTHKDLNIFGYAWDSSTEREAFGNLLLNLCEEVRPLLLAEKRLLRLQSPVYVLGDIHGNYKDLKIFERLFFKLGPKLCPGKLLFLGDYVDRGQFGCEVVAFLFAQKILAPYNVYLLRGNHEDRFINGHPQYQFKAQCMGSFGSDLGVKVFDKVNETFDCMPLAATIDNSIFCVHGGIPAIREGCDFDGNIESINKIPAPLSCVESNITALQLLWNDPLPAKGTQDPRLNSELEKFKDGFCTNLSRTGGAIDYPIKYFSTHALQDFLKRNDLKFVIRAHEVAVRGFYLRRQFRMLTVFASSFYCGKRSCASAILVADNRLRQLKIDTTDHHVIDEANATNETLAQAQGKTKYTFIPSCYPKACKLEQKN